MTELQGTERKVSAMTTHWFRKLRGNAHASELGESAAADEATESHLVAEALPEGEALPEIVAESISVVHDGGPSASAQLTQTLSSVAGRQCSIEFHTSETLSRSEELRASRGTTRVDADGLTHHDRISTVVVPLRTLKAADAASSRRRSERFAQQSTQAGCNPLADTVGIAADAVPGAVREISLDVSSESVDHAAALAEHRG
jgi:hypothetical protein